MGSAAQQLIVYDFWSGGGDPVQIRIAREVFEGQERDTFHDEVSGTGTRAADGG
jgi:hypothetical protein